MWCFHTAQALTPCPPDAGTRCHRHSGTGTCLQRARAACHATRAVHRGSLRTHPTGCSWRRGWTRRSKCIARAVGRGGSASGCPAERRGHLLDSECGHCRLSHPHITWRALTMKLTCARRGKTCIAPSQRGRHAQDKPLTLPTPILWGTLCSWLSPSHETRMLLCCT